jgi:hypothetical protein
MTGMGIIEGDETTGLFDPDGQFTREAAAKIITYMVLGPEAAENLSGTNAGFSDVPNTRWSAPYIAYAKGQKIIEGYGNGKFGPTDDLSRAAWLKMLLVSLGVDPDKNGMGDDTNWDVNAQALAVRTGLIDAADLQLDWNRETAVYYAFLAMQKENKFADILVNDEDTASQIKVDPYVPNLKSEPTAGDEYGRPGVNWTNGKTGKAKVIYATGIQEPVVTYTSTQKATDVVKALGLKTGTSLASVVTAVYVDGEVKTTTATVDEEQVTVNDVTLVSGNDIGGNGTVVEFYLNADEKTYTVVEIPTYVVELPKATKDADKNDVFVLEGSGDTALTIPADGYAKGDIVTYNKGVVKNETAALNVTKLESTEGKITASNTTPSYVKVDGEKKEYSANYAQTLTVGKSYDLYYDEYGYIIYSANPQVQGYDGYVYVVATQAKNGNTSATLVDAAVTDKVAAVAQIIDADGNISVVERSIAQDKTGNYYYTDKNGKVTDTPVETTELTKVNKVLGYNLVDGKYVFGAANDADENVAAIPNAVITLTKDATATTTTAYTLTTTTKITKVTYKVANEANNNITATAATATSTTGFATENDATVADQAYVLLNANGSAKEIVYFVEGAGQAPATLAVYLGDGENIDGVGATSKFLINGEEVSLNLNSYGVATPAKLDVWSVKYNDETSKLTAQATNATAETDVQITVLDDGYINGKKIADNVLVYDASQEGPVTVSSVSALAEKNAVTIYTDGTTHEIVLIIVTADEYTAPDAQ